MPNDLDGKLRFLGRHRCPQCRMPLHAEEIKCPICDLQIVYVNESGEVMVHMIAIEDPSNWHDEMVQQYHAMLAVETAGDIFFPKHYFQTISQNADVVQLPDGSLAVRYANRVTLDEIRKVEKNSD